MYLKTVRRRHELRASGPVELSMKMEGFSAALRMRGGRILAIQWQGGAPESARRAEIRYQVAVPADGAAHPID